MSVLERMDKPARGDTPMNDPWVSVDPLGEALHYLRMSGVFYTRSEFTSPRSCIRPSNR